MNLFHLFEAATPRIVVTYPGRFQPFHQGHHDVFKSLQQTFGANNVYILTSDKTDNKKSPFNFADKTVLMTAAGVPANRIIETSNMYSLPEEFDAQNTIFIAAVGAPDANRLKPDSTLVKDTTDKYGNYKPAGSPGYYKTWTGQQPVTADQHGYVVIVPEKEKYITIGNATYDVSHGTECRNLWNKIRDNPEAKQSFLTQLYGKATPELEEIFNKIPYSQTTEDVSPMGQSTISPISGNSNRIKEEAAGVGVIANKKQRKDPRYSMSLTKDVKPGAIQRSLRAFRLAESINKFENKLGILKYQLNEEKENSNAEFMNTLELFFPIAMSELKLDKLPKIKLQKNVEVHGGQATFGRFVPEEMTIYLALEDRHPIDIIRTLAHELVHFKQKLQGHLGKHSGRTGSPQENEAHVKAGIIMRHFNKKYPDLVRLHTIDF